ncbi:LVIVD repeat-containing protein [Calditrichota bacterium GD2]
MVDVSNPSNPQEVGYYDTPDDAHVVVVRGRYVYVADSSAGLLVLDVSDPANPQEVGYYDAPGFATGLDVNNGYAYMAAGDQGLRVIDVSDPSNPQEVGSYEMPFNNTRNVAVSEMYVYTVGDQGLRVIDVSDPTNPQLVGYYDTPDYAYGVAVSGEYIYAANWKYGMYILRNDLTMEISAEQPALPRAFALGQSYPIPSIRKLPFGSAFQKTLMLL